MKKEREFFLDKSHEEKNIDYMSIPQLKDEYNMWMERYNHMVDGYDRADGADGVHILGYRELMKRNQELEQEPERLLDTDVGKKALESEKKILYKRFIRK